MTEPINDRIQQPNPNIRDPAYSKANYTQKLSGNNIQIGTGQNINKEYRDIKNHPSQNIYVIRWMSLTCRLTAPEVFGGDVHRLTSGHNVITS